MNRKLLGYIWLATWLPFLTLPWVTIAQGQAHFWFHVSYIPVIVVSLYLLLRFLRQAPTRAQRVIAGAAMLFQGAALLGHAGELVAVVRFWINDGYASTNTDEIFLEDPLHTTSAMFAPTGLMLGLVAVLVLTITAWWQGRSARRKLTSVS